MVTMTVEYDEEMEEELHDRSQEIGEFVVELAENTPPKSSTRLSYSDHFTRCTSIHMVLGNSRDDKEIDILSPKWTRSTSRTDQRR